MLKSKHIICTRNQETIVIVGTKKILTNNHSDQEHIDIIIIHQSLLDRISDVNIRRRRSSEYCSSTFLAHFFPRE